MRHQFGGGLAAWAMVESSSYAHIAPGAEVRAYNAPSGGVRVVDLAMDAAGVNVVGTIIADEAGRLPVFYGPDGVAELWLSANNGPRVRALPSDGGSILDGSAATLTAASNALDAVEATVGEPGGIAPLNSGGKLPSSAASSHSLSSSDDVNLSGAQSGDSLLYEAGIWTPSHVDNSSYPTEWAVLPLVSGMKAGDSIPAYRFIDPSTVQLRGMIKRTNDGAFDYCDAVVNLPTGTVPASTWYPQGACAGPRTMNVGILSTGQIVLYPYTSTSTWMSLDGIMYDVAYGAMDAPTTYTTTWTATWSNTYDGSNYAYGGNLCYQGNSGVDGRGNQRSLIGWDSAAIRAEIEGAVMVKIVLSLYFPHWWYSAGGTACIGTHNYLSNPSTWSGSRVNERRWTSSGWPRHSWRDITLPNSVAGEFADGDTTGIALGPAPSSSQTYYGYAYGAYQSAKPYLTITYQK